jgi:hypothetical protein
MLRWSAPSLGERRFSGSTDSAGAGVQGQSVLCPPHAFGAEFQWKNDL